MQSSQDRNSSLAFCFVVALFVAGAASAEAGTIPFQEASTYDGPQPHGPGAPLVSHLPHNFGGLTSDSMGFGEPGSTIVYQFVADDFALPFDSQVRRIVFWGFYNSQVLPIGDESFQINFHEPRESDGLPSDVIFSEMVVNPFREWTGRNVISSFGGREYRFVVDLAAPLVLPGSETRWLSIYQIGDPNSSFRWEDSTTEPQTGHAFQNTGVPNWTTTNPFSSVNTAFQLYSIPEPSAGAFLLAGAFGIGCHSRLREANL